MDNKQPSSSKNMSEISFAVMNEDLLQNILCRLPAKSFASAACVSKYWNKVCNGILIRPKIASACSFDASTRIALQKVLDKVLSEPIRPHFAIANVGKGFGLKRTLQSLVKFLGSRIPIILSSAHGLIGRDAHTDEFREVKFGDDEYGDDNHHANDWNSGIVLTVGFMPGLKVDAIPLVRLKKVHQAAVIDQFVTDIRNYTTSVSGCMSPVGIIMFGNEGIDQKYIVEKMDYAMSMNTVIVGDERSQFLYRTGNDLRNVSESPKYNCDAVALIFASDKDKPHGIGEYQFHLALSKGVSAIGSRYKAVSVRANDSDRVTWLTARREGQQEILDGQQILDAIYDELENPIQFPELYIGVTKRRKCSIGSEKSRPVTSMTFHGVIGGDQEYFYVDGVGIKTGDYFQFYQPRPDAALAACRNVSTHLKNLKLDFHAHNSLGTRGVANNIDKKEVLGGFIFSCCGRGNSFFGCPNIDSSPFLENFPNAPLAGIFCGGEIGRGYLSLADQESQEECLAHCCLHVYSTVYLVMSYWATSSEC